MSDWNSKQYLKFKQERTQPSIDLANRISQTAPARILDVGCGPGNSTKVLAERFPGAALCGIDSSPDMVAAAKNTLPSAEFLLMDVSKDLHTLGRTFDVVFSNACIQWIPNHHELLPNLLSLLRPGGELAIQTPLQAKMPTQHILANLTAAPRWNQYFSGGRIFYNLSTEDYFDLLTDTAADCTIWETTYIHRMDGYHAILEWYRGTGLRPYLNALPEALHPDFEQAFLEQLKQVYHIQKNGQVLFPFPRLFLLATTK